MNRITPYFPLKVMLFICFPPQAIYFPFTVKKRSDKGEKIACRDGENWRFCHGLKS